jgi:hypothetical protein
MLLTCVFDLSNWEYNLKYKYWGLTPKFSGKRNFYEIKKIGAGQFFRGRRDDNLSMKLNWPKGSL